MTPRALLLAVAALTCGLPATSASAAGGACPSMDDGVTVVVDFQSLGGGVVVRCAPGDPDSGLAALAGAGFRVDQVANQPGFVCRIDGRPGTDTEDCADTPPASAYWGYSHAERGGSWSYSGSGAHVYDPPVGSVEGWAFNGDGGSSRPTDPPPPPPAEPEPSPSPSPSPTSTPTSPPPAPAASSSPTSSPASGPSHATAGTPGATEAGTTPPTAPAEAGTPSPSPPVPSPTDGPATPTAAATAPPSTPPATTSSRAAAITDPDGTPWGTAVGVALILLLAAGGALVGARRARRQP